MSPTLSSELAIDTCPLLVNLQYLDEFQGNLLWGIDKFFVLAWSVVQLNIYETVPNFIQ